MEAGDALHRACADGPQNAIGARGAGSISVDFRCMHRVAPCQTLRNVRKLPRHIPHFPKLKACTVRASGVRKQAMCP